MPPEHKGEFTYPLIEEVVSTNRELTRETGDPHNVIQPANLSFAVDGLKSKYNEKPFQEALLRKAAFFLDALANKGHAFADGNKRTALSTTLSFLRSNALKIDTSNEADILEFILSVARGEKSLNAVVRWLTKRVITLEVPKS